MNKIIIIVVILIVIVAAYVLFFSGGVEAPSLFQGGVDPIPTPPPLPE